MCCVRRERMTDAALDIENNLGGECQEQPLYHTFYEAVCSAGIPSQEVKSSDPKNASLVFPQSCYQCRCH
jgi:hypothetical protein